MDTRDISRLAWGSIAAHRLRSLLTMLGIVIGIASVILLTSLGEGTRAYLVSEFTQFGTNVMAIHRGRTTTGGVPGAVMTTTHKLTLDDSEALLRLPGVQKVVPVAYGSARVEAGVLGRSVFIYGVTSDVPAVWKFRVRQGRFLPSGDPRRSAPLAVLGPKLKREIFGDRNALGERVRIGGARFQVIGVMEPKGQLLGLDMDDAAYVPVARAQDLFNQDELLEIDLTFSPFLPVERIKQEIRRTLMRRHGGEEDFTITSQTEMLDILNRVMGVMNLAVGGIGAIALVVGAIGILTMMWISVGERTSEIGLLKAIGATPAQILALFLLEAALLSSAGGAIGTAAGLAIALAVHSAFPAIPLAPSPGFIAAALLVSLAVGLASGTLPARRAAALQPLEALRAE